MDCRAVEGTLIKRNTHQKEPSSKGDHLGSRSSISSLPRPQDPASASSWKWNSHRPHAMDYRSC